VPERTFGIAKVGFLMTGYTNEQRT
jgi:hypothetical protein